jgi:FAD/FMN-containing dehydrogenase
MYLPADAFLMSATRGMEGYAVTLTFTERDGESWEALRAGLRALATRCADLGGRVHLVKNVEVEPADMRRMYGEALARFLALKQRYDPRGMLRNEFFDRVFAGR